MSEENKDLKKQVAHLKIRTKEIDQDRFSIDDLIEKNEALERARDKFRNQTLDQKQEIKKLKQKLESHNVRSSFQESTHEERPLRKITPKQESKKLNY